MFANDELLKIFECTEKTQLREKLTSLGISFLLPGEPLTTRRELRPGTDRAHLARLALSAHDCAVAIRCLQHAMPQPELLSPATKDVSRARFLGVVE